MVEEPDLSRFGIPSERKVVAPLEMPKAQVRHLERHRDLTLRRNVVREMMRVQRACVLQAVREIGYAKWREYESEDTMRFSALTGVKPRTETFANRVPGTSSDGQTWPRTSP